MERKKLEFAIGQSDLGGFLLTKMNYKKINIYISMVSKNFQYIVGNKIIVAVAVVETAVGSVELQRERDSLFVV